MTLLYFNFLNYLSTFTFTLCVQKESFLEPLPWTFKSKYKKQLGFIADVKYYVISFAIVSTMFLIILFFNYIFRKEEEPMYPGLRLKLFVIKE